MSLSRKRRAASAALACLCYVVLWITAGAQNCNTLKNKARWNNLRLPRTLVPHLYEAVIHPDLERLDFRGWSCVEVLVNDNTDYIVMHVKKLNLSNIDVRFKDRNDSLEIKEHVISDEREQLQIELTSLLLKGSRLLINVSFHAALRDDCNGFFFDSYKTKNGVERFMAATQFESIQARSAFPCFDEPNMRARFKFSIIRPNNYISLFNTEKVWCDAVLNYYSSNETMDVFETTVKMSTYLVAFVVCDYKSKSKINNGVIVKRIQEVDLALNTVVDLLEYFETLYEVKYPLKKLDNVPVVNFHYGSMENWGNIIYHESYLLFNAVEGSESDKIDVVMVIAHEVAHQWFGNLVTMDWWGDLWLKEGFATFAQYFGVKHVFPDWPIMEDFAYDVAMHGLTTDAVDSSTPIIISMDDTKNIMEHYNDLTYLKSASLIQMLKTAFGSHLFNTAVKNYMNKHQFDCANKNDLWDSFNQQLDSMENINVKEMMDTWTLQMGFPVVSIIRNGRQVTCHQERFVIVDHSKLGDFEIKRPKFNYTWIIPLTYVTDTNPHNHSNVFMKEKTSLFFHIHSNNNTDNYNIYKNPGFYRVNYDANGWSEIIKQLKTNHNVFDVLDRGSLINDVFALLSTNLVNLNTAFNLSLYLEKELNCHPWRMMMGNIWYTIQKFSTHPKYHLYTNFMKKLMTPVLKNLGFKEEGDYEAKLIRPQLMTLAAHMGFPEYVDWVQESFKQQLSTFYLFLQRLSPNQRDIVYSYAVRYGGEKEWNYVMNLALADDASRIKSLLKSLTLSKNLSNIEKLIDLALNKSLVQNWECYIVLINIILNSIHQESLWKLITKNWTQIHERYFLLFF
ncbi:hypothetical protein HELRODRAFT_85912 [Helobdella robusta]|uniref:Aminopeptidase n=1 Tax=Helobdella robusta TaxID=6412 RepID=T1G642_HELRO|nr:hypothetical protein HELRODRAFT_85912 [Helobdella robusta]ESN97056.1 hypothetical protein HELRODRAFT_85912 [Helobdella robusta]